ncbi:MAG: hypothetical protein P8N70_09960, partial [Akkermansiaceae bacterium]|nr:hypothetical protein [Akkermansiaceae bacterium]
KSAQFVPQDKQRIPIILRCPDKENGDSLMEAAALTKIHRPDDFSFLTRTVLKFSQTLLSLTRLPR